MASLRVWNGSAWVSIPNGTKARYWNGSAWVNPKTVRAWNGSSWVTVWSKADPITRTFYADFSTNIRWNGSSAAYDSSASAVDNTEADLYIGRFNGSFPYHFTSVLGFGNAVEGGSLATALALRPTVKSATLRLYRVSGGLSSPSGNINAGAWTQGSFRTLPSTSVAGTYHDWTPVSTTSVSGWSVNATKTIAIQPQNILDLNAGKGLMLAEVLSGYTTSGATTAAYMRLKGVETAGATEIYRPKLTVVLDYS